MDHPNVQERIQKTMEELAKYQAREGIFTRPYVVSSAKTMWRQLLGREGLSPGISLSPVHV